MSAVETVVDDIILGRRPGAEPYNRVFVVSAYSGITDLLLEHKKTGEAGVYALYAGSENEGTWSEALARTAAAMHEKNRAVLDDPSDVARSEEHTSELQSLMRISYAVFCLKKKKRTIDIPDTK